MPGMDRRGGNSKKSRGDDRRPAPTSKMSTAIAIRIALCRVICLKLSQRLKKWRSR